MRIRHVPVLLLPLALLAPSAWSGLIVAVIVMVAWRSGRGEWRRLLWILLALAILAFATPAGLNLRTETSAGALERLRVNYDELWVSLDRDAERAVAGLHGLDASKSERATLFGRLEADVEKNQDGNTLLLLDPNRSPAAWAGEGLLHEIMPADLPSSGPTWRLGFTAATMVTLRPVPSSPGWSVLVGRSFSTGSLPKELLGNVGSAQNHWTLASPADSPPQGVTAIPGPPDGPSLWLQLDSLRNVGERRVESRVFRASGAVILALALIVAASSRRASVFAVAVLVFDAALCGANGWGLSWPGAVFLGLAAAAAWLVWKLARAEFRPGPAGGRIVMPLLLSLQFAALGGWLWSSAAGHGFDVHSLAVGALIGSTMLLLAAGLSRGLGLVRLRSAWLLAFFVAALIAAGGLQIGVMNRLLCLAIATLAASAYLGRRPGGVAPAVTLLLLGSALGGAGWMALGPFAPVPPATTVSSRPPSADEMATERRTLGHALDLVSPASWIVPDLRHLDPQDLALYVWRHSPLARTGLLSALSVYQDQRLVSSFSFGLPMRENGALDRSPSRWQDLQLAGWENSLSEGQGRLLGLGGPLALHYWALLRPGFRLDGGVEGNLAAGLLRGSARESTGGLTAADLQRGGGEAARLRPSRFGDVLHSVTDRIDRDQLVNAGVTAAAVLLAACAALGVLLVLWVPPGRLRDHWRTAWHSYSQRLVLVFAFLVLLTLLPLNAVMVSVVSRRLDAQQVEDGLASLESTQRVLGEYVLSLEPGFSLDTTLNDELLSWLSRVVHHQVNLYWGSSVYASSRPELFTAGLLPVRIPGEIYSRLALRGASVASRRNRVGETSYLELYAPLRIPGAPSQEKLFVSLPLLAQQEAVANEMATLRRRTLLSAGFLFLLLSAVGARLARSFTRPLHQIVEGTRRIAGGAESIDVAPQDVELAALARAIDEMAARIAEGRERLMGEKRLMEKVVENVTSGVVSLDAKGRVMMCNRVARQLLHVEPGVELRGALVARPEFGPVLAVLEEASAQPATRTLQLEEGDGGAREWTAIHAALPGPGDPASLLVVEDVTEVLRGQRLAAWAEMARIIAHEIKNPLTPIQLSTEHLREVWKAEPAEFGPVLERCTGNILRQVDELRQIAGEFSTFSQIPRLELRQTDLVATIREIVESYQRPGAHRPMVELMSAPESCPAHFDARLLGRAVRNLVENSLRAVGESGRVMVRVECQAREARVIVADEGPGVPPENLSRIFDPYFSTHEGGTGLGLPISRRIAEEHGGTLTAANRGAAGGLEVVFRLPRNPGGGRSPAEDDDREPGGSA